MNGLKILIVSFILVCLFSFTGSAIIPLYTRETPNDFSFFVPPLISVYQDFETGNILLQQMGETEVLIMKNPLPSPEVTQNNSPSPTTSFSSNLIEIPTSETVPSYSPSPAPIGTPKKPEEANNWKYLGEGLISGFQSDFFINEKSIRTVQISDSKFFLFRCRYDLNQNDSNRVQQLIETVIRFILNQGDTIPNTTPLNMNNTLWIISLSENDKNWSIENIQEEIFFDPARSRFFVQKRYYYDADQKLIATALISDIPLREEEIEPKPWMPIITNSPYSIIIEFAQKYINQ